MMIKPPSPLLRIRCWLRLHATRETHIMLGTEPCVAKVCDGCKRWLAVGSGEVGVGYTEVVVKNLTQWARDIARLAVSPDWPLPLVVQSGDESGLQIEMPGDGVSSISYEDLAGNYRETSHALFDWLWLAKVAWLEEIEAYPYGR